MRDTRRLFVCAFLTDASLYLAFAALPFRALELGAGPARIGILPTLYAAAYMASATLGGRLSDRVSRLALARGGSALFAAGCLALALAPGLPAVFATLPVLGLALGFFWSPLQAALADRAEPGRLAAAVSSFNVSWSLGKGTGLVLGGAITEALEPRTALLVAGFPVLVNLALLPRARAAAGAAGAEPPAPAAPPADPGLLVRAWAVNAIAFGTAGTMNMHAPAYLLARGAGPAAFGAMLGAVFLVQTLAFVAQRAFRPSRRGLIGACAAAIAGLGLFVLWSALPLRVLAAVPLGVAFGTAYHASIHASLDRREGRGRAAGFHEAILGAGSSSLPLLGGAAAAAGSLAAPFGVAAAALAAGLLLTATGRGGARRAAAG
jgi:predicted MFS family arabinose efflux permease